MEKILDWPIREMLLCYIALLKEQAFRTYQTSVLVWASRTAMGGKQKPPELPKILKER